MYRRYPDVDKQFATIQNKPTPDVDTSFIAANDAPPIITANAKPTNNSTFVPKKMCSPTAVVTFEIFLNMVTMGTELCSREVMPVNSMRQNKILTGAHCIATVKSKDG